MSDSTHPTGGVFLSYAREDAGAARHIAEGLRGAGVEVWFDQSELRGGDAWDAKLRGQIKACALFLPIISQHSEERSEGYFRREWKLAVDRTNDMAGGRAFLVPIVIDGTEEAGATVPEEFMRYQWVRLARGAPTPDFIAQIRHLLETPRHKPALKPNLPRPPTLPPEFKAAAQAKASAQSAPAKKSVPAAAIALAFGAVVISAGLIAYVIRRGPPATSASAVEAKPPAPAPAAPTQPQVDPKSIAVLPFENYSTDKENAFFADGVHEDILTSLAKIAELKVISRTSVMEYRDTKKKIQQIAGELGVAYVLEGSVRRAGNTVRITVQLIDGRNGQHVLAPDPYDRDLSDIFAIQSEVAQNIATKLQAAISPGAKASLERAPTTNLTAYDLFLKAREVSATQSDLRIRIERTLPLLESAVQYDPNFALAWLAIAQLHLSAFTANGFDPSEARRVQVKTALDRAVALDPDHVAIIAMLANYYIDVLDLEHAQEQAERLKRLYPNHAATFHVLARLATRQDDRPGALANYRKAQSLDPRNYSVYFSLQSMLWTNRRYAEAEIVMREAAAAVGDKFNQGWLRALIAFDARESTVEAEALLAKIPPDARRNDPLAIGALSGWASICGDADAVIRLWEQSGSNWRMSGGYDQLGIAIAFVVKGQPEKARPILEKERTRLLALLAARPRDGNAWFQVAMTHALLGKKKEALEAREKMLAAITATTGPGRRFNDVVFYAWVGEKDKALAELANALPLTSGLNGLSVHRMRHGLFFQPLQGDPRFDAILNDPKNNAPIF